MSDVCPLVTFVKSSAAKIWAIPFHPAKLHCSSQRKLWVLSRAFYGFEQKNHRGIIPHVLTVTNNCTSAPVTNTQINSRGIFMRFLPWEKITDSNNVCDYFILWKMPCLFLAAWSFWVCVIRTLLSNTKHQGLPLLRSDLAALNKGLSPRSCLFALQINVLID